MLAEVFSCTWHMRAQLPRTEFAARNSVSFRPKTADQELAGSSLAHSLFRGHGPFSKVSMRPPNLIKVVGHWRHTLNIKNRKKYETHFLWLLKSCKYVDWKKKFHRQPEAFCVFVVSRIVGLAGTAMAADDGRGTSISELSFAVPANSVYR